MKRLANNRNEEKMETIIYIGSFEMPDKNAAAHRVLNNARNLRELGLNVVFVGLNENADTEFLKTKYEYDSFEIYEIKCGSAFDKIIKFSSFEWLEELFLRYKTSAIIAYDYYALGLYKLKKLCNKKGIPLIADTDEWFAGSWKSVEGIVRKIDSALRMRVIQPKVDGIIAISQFLYDYYCKKLPTVKIPPLVDCNDEKYKGGNTENEVPTLVYSGSPSASKEALGDVVKALNRLADIPFKLKVVGVTREAFKQIYNVDINDKKFEFLGRVSHKDALDAVKSSDYSLIIRPVSRVTMAGFPTKFAEAISCGTAVIANNTSDLANYLKDEKNGYLVSNENLEQDLRVILSQKSVPEVERQTFDYRNYKNSFEQFLTDIGVL